VSVSLPGRPARRATVLSVTTAADDELFGDTERRNILEGRLRQLHGDLYALEMHLSEEEADPHGNSKQVAQFRKDIQTVKARISTVQKLHRALPKPAAEGDGSGDAPAG
jgi:hypothetical protein